MKIKTSELKDLIKEQVKSFKEEVKIRQLVREILKENSPIKPPDPDLRGTNSFTDFLNKNIQAIYAMKSSTEIINFIQQNITSEYHVSEKYLNHVYETLRKAKSVISAQKYLTDVMLKGEGLGSTDISNIKPNQQ